MKLPYFKWYPADAEMDQIYAAMTDQELGFYHRCLNKSWPNGGSLPSDPGELARLMKVTPEYLASVWGMVGRCFRLCKDDSSRVVNPRLHREHSEATEKSRKATDAVRTRYERSTDELPRAYVSVFDSVVGSKKKEKEAQELHDVTITPFQIAKLKERSEPKPISSAGFDVWWERWVKLTKRAQRRTDALRAWIGMVDEDQALLVAACLDRYGKSDEVARGVVCNPDKWLYDQGRENWTGDWPPARASPEQKPARGQLKNERMRQLAKDMGMNL